MTLVIIKNIIYFKSKKNSEKKKKIRDNKYFKRNILISFKEKILNIFNRFFFYSNLTN